MLPILTQKLGVHRNTVARYANDCKELLKSDVTPYDPQKTILPLKIAIDQYVTEVVDEYCGGNIDLAAKHLGAAVGTVRSHYRASTGSQVPSDPRRA